MTDEEWTLYSMDGSDDLHDMTARMRETHELSGDCWCRPIGDVPTMKGRERVGTLWTHNDLEAP